MEIRLDHFMMKNDAASQWLGLSINHLGDGEATLSTTLRPEMMNGFGITHGGFIFAIGDSAFAFACNPADSDGTTQTVAAGVDINFLKPSYSGDLITAQARRRTQSGRSGLYDIQIFRQSGDGEQELIAEFRGRSRTIPTRSPSAI